MADERYQKFLGIEPSDEVPNYYELLAISRDEHDMGVIETAYKTQIRKLQEIRTSKDKGFIEFLKEELREAKRILAKAEKRKEYDEGLVATALDGFKNFVGSLMVMGHINKTLYDTMVQRGVADGLSPEQAKSAIENLAQQHGATLETEDSGPPPAPAAAASGGDEGGYGEYEDPNSGYGETTYEEAGYGDAGYEGYEGYGDYDPAGQDEPAYADYSSAAQGEPDYGDFADERGDDEPPPPPAPRGETVLQAPARPDRPPPPPVQTYHEPDDFVDDQEAAPARPAGPWWKGVGDRPPPWGRRTGSEYQVIKQAPRKPGQPSAPRSKELEDAIRLYNLGAALAKVASDVHEKLRLYFPPGKPPAKNINGVPPQKVLDTEQSTYRECLKKFQNAMDRIGSSGGGDADLIRVRSTQSVSLVRGILDEIKAHKLRLMGGLPQQEEARAWQEFVGRSRPGRLTRVID